MLISIIIPVYNYLKITDTLDGLEAQIENDSRFEIIVVDDASTDDTYGIAQRHILSKDYANIQLLRHVQNKRIGGARNTGMAHMKGSFALFLDADDRFADGSLGRVAAHLEGHPELDILMCDYELVKNGHSKKIFHYQDNNQAEMPGSRFIVEQDTPWVAWLYAYRLGFLNRHGLRFEENTLFEDNDFVLECTVKAKNIQYQPILLVSHHAHDKQTSKVGDDVGKIIALFENCHRTRCVAERNRQYGQDAYQALTGHYLFACDANLKRFFWRLPYGGMREVQTKYPPCHPGKGYPLVWLCAKYPRAFRLISLVAKPLLHLAYAVKQLITA